MLLGHISWHLGKMSGITAHKILEILFFNRTHRAPAGECVMGFIGSVNSFGGRLKICSNKLF